MSRSNKQPRPIPDEYWVGRHIDKVPLRRQSKYDRDVLSLPLPLAEIEDSDSHYNKFDLDEPEYYKDKKS